MKNWEMWNEPNISSFWKPEPDAEQYAKLMRAGYSAAKRANPDVTVGSGGMSGLGRSFFRELKELGALEDMDVLIIHPYQPTDTEANRALEKDLRELYSIAPGKELWVTEWGWNINRQANLREQAEWTVKGYLLKYAMAIRKVGLYSFNILTDQGFGVNSSEIAGETRPVYPAISGMNHILRNREYIGNMDTGQTRIMAFGREGEQPLLAVWSDTDSTLQLDTPDRVKQYDIFGNVQELEPREGIISVAISSAPIFLEGMFSVSEAQPLFEVAAQDERSLYARYNFTVRFTGDTVKELDKVGGDWSTVSAGMKDGGWDGGQCAEFQFKTKTGVTGQKRGEYGFRFPLVNGKWEPVSGIYQSFAEAFQESDAVSLWLKAPPSEEPRRITLLVQTKSAGSGQNVNFRSPAVALRQDGEWELLQVPLDEFVTENGLRLSELGVQELESSYVPYKFAVEVGYQDFMLLDQIPQESVTGWLKMDDVMLERRTDFGQECVYPVAVPERSDAPEYTACELIGAENAKVDLQTEPIRITTDLSPEEVRFLTGTPPVLTDVAKQEQYRSGAYVRLTAPAKLRVIAGNFRNYQDIAVEWQNKGPVDLSLKDAVFDSEGAKLTFQLLYESVPENAYLYVAAYDQNKIMKSVKRLDVAAQEINVQVRTAGEKLLIKAFVWENKMRPLSQVVSIKEEGR